MSLKVGSNLFYGIYKNKCTSQVRRFCTSKVEGAQEKWADNARCMGTGLEDVLKTWMNLALSVESALVEGSTIMGMYRELRRKFVMAGHVGMEFAASTGIVQSCPLSVLSLNLLMNTWARSVKVGTIAAMEKVYADDAGVLSKNCEEVDVASKNKTRDVRQSHTAKTERRKNQCLGHHCIQQEISS